MNRERETERSDCAMKERNDELRKETLKCSAYRKLDTMYGNNFLPK